MEYGEVLSLEKCTRDICFFFLVETLLGVFWFLADNNNFGLRLSWGVFLFLWSLVGSIFHAKSPINTETYQRYELRD